MVGTQNETLGKVESGRRKAEGIYAKNSTFSPRPSAFTLTELLVVITIIAILAGLVTGAAVNALDRAKEAAITLELQQIATAAEDFKNKYGAYPPNVISRAGVSATSNELNIVRSDLNRALSKAFPRLDEHGELELIDKLIGNSNSSGYNATTPNEGGPLVDRGSGNPRPNGLTAAEAVVLWLGGFSKDPARPFSGPGGPSFTDGQTNANGVVEDPDVNEVLEDRNWADGFEFDLGRLGPRDANGVFSGRYIVYTDVDSAGNEVDRRINLWTYTPSGSQQPCIYFDTSKADPDTRFNGNYNLELQSRINALDANSPIIYALRQPLENVSVANPAVNQSKFVSEGKFQILHCGTDDIWGDFSAFSSDSSVNGNSVMDDSGNNPAALLAPEGPFIGDVADTLGNFMTGTLEDKQE